VTLARPAEDAGKSAARAQAGQELAWQKRTWDDWFQRPPEQPGLCKLDAAQFAERSCVAAELGGGQVLRSSWGAQPVAELPA